MKYRYTEKECKQLLSNMVIQVDTREQVNQHILDFFIKNKIQYEEKALKTGDYSLYIKKCPELGIMCDWWADDLTIEKKSGLDELSGNMKEERFFNEIKRTVDMKHKFLIIENGSWEDILAHNYRSQYNEKAFFSQMIKLQTKYNFKIIFTQNAGFMIYQICRWVLELEILK